MAKHKHTTLGHETNQIVGQVQRILAAGERLRTALLSEHWMDDAGQHADQRQRWLHARAATDRAEAAYGQAIDECYRLAEEAASHGAGRNPGRETRPVSSALQPTQLFSSF